MTQKNRFVPDHIRNLDDDALKQFIKAPNTQSHAPPPPNTTRQVQQESLTKNISVVSEELKNDMDMKELEHLKSLNEETGGTAEITRSDMLRALHEEINQDESKGELADLESDAVMVDSIIDGCQHVMSSGRRKGEKCGRKVSIGNKCSNHKYK